MSDLHTTPPPNSVFDLIEDALGSTARGRAFLAECQRRARSEETALLLDAVARLERRADASRGDLDRDDLRTLIGQVEVALREARRAARQSTRYFRSEDDGMEPEPASRDVDGAPPTLLGAVELIQETAWAMREAGFDGSLCDRLDEQTSVIYAACSRQNQLFDRLDGAIDRAHRSAVELRRRVEPDARMSVPLDRPNPDPAEDGDLEFVPSPSRDDRE